MTWFNSCNEYSTLACYILHANSPIARSVSSMNVNYDKLPSVDINCYVNDSMFCFIFYLNSRIFTLCYVNLLTSSYFSFSDNFIFSPFMLDFNLCIRYRIYFYGRSNFYLNYYIHFYITRPTCLFFISIFPDNIWSNV